jgi:hypothetical protein
MTSKRVRSTVLRVIAVVAETDAELPSNHQNHARESWHKSNSYACLWFQKGKTVGRAYRRPIQVRKSNPAER